MLKSTCQSEPKNHIINFQSIRWKSAFISFLSAFIIAILLIFNLLQTNFQSGLLKDIRDTHYPIQAKYQKAFYVLEKIHSELEDAVITGETDYLEKAETLKVEFIQSINSILEKDLSQQKQITSINESFINYYEGSYKLAQEIINNNFNSEFGRIAEKNILRYQQTINMLETANEDKFHSLQFAIDNVSDRAKWFLHIGVPLGVFLVFFLVLFSMFMSKSISGRIQLIISTLENLARNDGDLSKRIVVEGQDEMAELSFWFNEFIAKLDKLTQESTQEIKTLAYTDTLTELPNRRYFNNYLQNEINHCSRSNTRLAVMFLDLDNFKTVNDTLGHDAGDELVKQIATRIKSVIRSTDWLSFANDKTSNSDEKNSVVARMGGDEFILALPDFSDSHNVINVANKIIDCIMEPVEIEGNKARVGASIGISLYPDDGNTEQELIRKADLAMYEAKRQGKNAYVIYNRKLDQEIKRDLMIEEKLIELVKDNVDEEFSFYFQPKFDIRSGQVVGAEALMRWKNKTLGKVSPDEFIPLAESKQVIYALDLYVLNKVCQHIHRWYAKTLSIPPIAINISAKTASTSGLSELIEEILHRYNLAPAAIEIEITETSAMEKIEVVAKNIQDLAKLGVKVALDDFGAGHASLSLLTLCKIDSLKIDKSFIDELSHKKNTIIEGIITLAQVLKIKTLAEGVETEEHLNALKTMNCELAQGYLFAKPMPEEDFIHFIQDTSNKHYIDYSKAS